jgi:C4-dicarboxylate-specific signal transduction histidine kinase
MRRARWRPQESPRWRAAPADLVRHDRCTCTRRPKSSARRINTVALPGRAKAVSLPAPPSTILYVEAEAIQRDGFRGAFADQFPIAVAATGQEALALLAREPVAVLVASQQLPDMSGVALCAEARERCADLTRIVITPYAALGPVMEAVKAGTVSRYVLQPWRADALADALHAAVQAAQLGALTRDVRVRLLQQEQQATMTFMLGRVLHEVVSPAVGIRDNLGFLADLVSSLAIKTTIGDPDAPRLAAELVPSLQDAYGAAQDLVSRLDRFRQGDATASDPGEGTSLERAVHAAAGIVRGRVRQRAMLVVDTTEKAIARADATQLSQILVNLLINACEAIDPGYPEKNQIVVATFAKGDRCGIVIEDSGRGIAPSVRDQLFEPYVSTKEQEPERGLGLAIVRELVETLGGRIEVSRGVRGTSFFVELPRAE